MDPTPRPSVLTHCRVADPEHAARIAEIHMAAFGPNAMLRAQFPSDEVRRGLQRSVEMKALADINDPKTTVVIAERITAVAPLNEAELPHDSDMHPPDVTIIGFAKWSHPIEAGDDYEEPPWIWPEGTDYDVLNGWIQATEEAQEAAIGSEPSYRLSFIATDPSYMRQGAGTLMTAWGVTRCQEQGVPAYLESTIEAVPFYKRLGFEPAVNISLKFGGGPSEDRTTEQEYNEVGMLYRPPAKVKETG